MNATRNLVIWIVGYAVALFLVSAVALRIPIARSVYIGVVLAMSLFFGVMFSTLGIFSTRTPSILIVGAALWIGFQFAWVTSSGK
jgi:hypothetical protein